MRILIILPYGGVGGMERLALSFYNQYKKEGYYIKAVKFISLDNDIINFGNDEIAFSNRDYIDMPKTKRLTFNLGIPLKLRKLIKKHHITHSISFGDPANFYSSITFTKEFKIGSIHALKSVEMSNNSKLSKLTKFGFEKTYKKFNKLVCISKAIKEDLIDNCGYKAKNLTVIYNPHDLKEILKLSKEPLNEEDSKIFNQDVILFLGRLTTQKSPWHLIKAFSIVLKQNPEAKLVFIGDGDPNIIKHLESLISTLKINEHIIFLGRKSNPYKYLIRSKILALSSHYEGTPNVIIEAICLNVPVVSSYCTKGISELMSLNDIDITNSKIEVESGIITPNFFKGTLGIPENNMFLEEEKIFAQAINQVLENDNFSTKLSNYKSDLLQKFDLKTVAKQYLLNEIDN